nr:DEAD/DEAH box helicase [uncultured Pedobacter sp.]
MNLEYALSLYSRIEDDRTSKSLFARANARYIMFGVNEERENFPSTLEYNLNIGSDSLAFSYLSIGCTLFENQLRNGQMRESLEKGAEFIEYNHLPKANRNPSSKYYLLVGGLAYYAASQYSKAFIIIKEAEDYQTDVSLLCSYFLKKNYSELNHLLNRILINQQLYLADIDLETKNIDSYHQVIIFAKSLANVMDFLYSGTEESLQRALEIQDDLLELLAIENEPSLWWVVRIFKIITRGLSESSLWSTIPFDPESSWSRKLTRKFIGNLIFGKKPIVELFVAQRQALPLVLSNSGAVVSLPTSSGKTQIAAVAILKCLLKNPATKVLYLAPFRSLAFEVETALKATFEKLDFEVSQLYGTGQFGKLDKLIINDASVLIATPEKTKVILRANDDIVEQIQLVIIDEGHLLDETKRNLINELYIEELKAHVSRNGAKIILLSAVLPNSDDIAKWICDDENACITGKERLSRQRIGIMDFKSNRVKLEWYGDEMSFNPQFIKAIPAARKKGLTQPNDKTMAVALVALKLSDKQKSVLLFTARARSVNTYAKALIKGIALQEDKKQLHVWTNSRDWEEFKLVCSEYDSNENKELLEYAKYGILCHRGSLNKEVRATIEKLMRNGNPRIIVATMTLGQGVNLGVSTVILADTAYYDQGKKVWKDLKSNEVWNIIGRAGRAFQDIEGKVLFTVESEPEREKADNYIKNKPENTYSGLLIQIKKLKTLARKCNVDFPSLIEMIAENDYKKFEKWSFKDGTSVNDRFTELFDWIDDSLVSMSLMAEELDERLDDYFRKTLAYIQGEHYPGIDQKEVIEFLAARNEALRTHILPDDQDWKSLATSSLPLACAIRLNEVFDDIIAQGNIYLQTSKRIDDRLVLLKNIEKIIAGLPSPTFKPELNEQGALKYSPALMDEARKTWLTGSSLAAVSDIKKIVKLCNSYFGYTITWVLGAIANKCKEYELEELTTVFEELAVCAELGLPDMLACKTYLTGIRSRIAAREIAETLAFIDLDGTAKLSEIRDFILEHMNDLMDEVENSLSKEWLKTLQWEHENRKDLRIKKIADFTLRDQKDVAAKRLYVKEFSAGELYLCSSDYEYKVQVTSNKNLPFHTIADRMDYFFEFKNGVWGFRRAT